MTFIPDRAIFTVPTAPPVCVPPHRFSIRRTGRVAGQILTGEAPLRERHRLARTYLISHLSRRPDVQARFLQCATEGTFGAVVQETILAHLAADPRAVRRVSARFTGMVPLPSHLTVRVSETAEGKAFAFDARGQDGALVLSAGALHLAWTVDKAAI